MNGLVALRRFRSSSVCWVLATLLTASATGCKPAAINPTGDPPSAKTALMNSLDDWKLGKKPEDMLETIPAVRIVDHDWAAGKQLKDYELVGDPVPDGGQWRAYAMLTLSEDGKDKPPVKVGYTITPAEITAIFRGDFND